MRWDKTKIKKMKNFYELVKKKRRHDGEQNGKMAVWQKVKKEKIIINLKGRQTMATTATTTSTTYNNKR